MKKSNPALPLIFGSLFLVSLTGCERVEQVANEALEQAKQSAVQAIDKAAQAGSIDEARQAANDALLDARQKAAGLLDQASEYLSEEPRGQLMENAPAEDSPSAI